AAAGCQELTSTRALDVSFLPDTGASSIPKEMFDGELKHVVMKATTAENQTLYSTHVVWATSADTIIRIDPGATCGLASEKTPLPEIHTCLHARGAGTAHITVRLEQPGLSVAETTFSIQVKQRWI